MKYTFQVILFLISLWTIDLSGQGQKAQYLDPEIRNEIKTIGESEKVQQAFQYILETEARTLDEHILLTEIPAPPFKETKRAEKWMEMIQIETGIDSVWMDEVGNVLALKKGSNGDKTIVLDAHLDTVFPEETDVTVQMRGDTLYAPGIGDDTRGLAMVLSVARAIHKTGIETDAHQLYIGSVGEEGLGDLRGVKHLFRSGGPKIDTWISIDGGNTGRVNNRGLGSYRYKVMFKGDGGHSWGAFGLANPHHALGSAIHNFVIEADRFTATGPRTSYNVGRIGGGTSINSIPFESWMEIDIRSIAPERLDSMENILRTACESALKEQNEIARIGEPLTLDFQKIGNRPSGSVDEGATIIQRAIGATAFIGKYPELTIGSTNSNIPISQGIPAVTIGRGGKALNAHSLNEWWLNDEGHLAIQLALLLFVTECGMN
ncbi:MAG: M20/M25/M40 family metallo-hydrolase [Bacteroidia bacterium]|nr:M20/M25/M40 family metallo-hydrolase [Bacteroidia bacterium]